MLKNIRLHIERDEDAQAKIEQRFAEQITQRYQHNINAFQRNIPALLPYIENVESQSIGLLANKKGQANIVDYGQGRVFYGFDPETEILQQVEAFLQRPQKVEIEKSSGASPDAQPAPDSISKVIASLPAIDTVEDHATLVVLGLGLGQHLLHLLENLSVKNLVVYEPELQYFKCSVMSTDWKHFFDLARKHDTRLFFQIGKDSRDLINNIDELRQHFAIKRFYLYEHYHHPVFDSVMKAFRQFDWAYLKHKGISFNFEQTSDEFCPRWTVPVPLETYHDVSRQSERFSQNLAAFKRYFPDIYAEFQAYQPRLWLPIERGEGATAEVNLINTQYQVSWYGEDVRKESHTNFDSFYEQPNKDSLVMGYSGEKLRHYVHYRFVKDAEAMLKDVEEQTGALPDNIKSLIMFGIGAGYQLEKLVGQHTVEKLFVCEPNRDFFYASLFAIDWHHILTTIDQQGGRLYINIGDDGSNLFRDLLNQFYSIGPYILANTYFYQSYYNASLNEAIAQLREQLQVVISMGEYFDHARFGITHTLEGIQRGYSHLVTSPETRLSHDEKEVPVFIVGNGPSLDYSIEVIKEWQENAIIVTCGTALQVLCNNGITPDFHAEIEQNRATFDWACRVDNFAFLKSVTLLSCNGVHPDTGDLYKDVFVAFKEGESSTVSTLNILGEDNYEILQFAFPTVTNFAVNLFIKLGLKQLYLFGVDLGFINADNHHSKQSGYYDTSGKPVYDYKERNNTSIVVPGNFLPTVYTKHEFKIAKMVLEQSLQGSGVECYNTSNGARILGSMPLQVDNVLISSAPETKQTVMQSLRSKCFGKVDASRFFESHHNKYSKDALSRELMVFNDVLDSDVRSLEQAEKIIEKQKELLFSSYSHGASLLFYYLYGTVNFANAFLSKLLNSTNDEKQQVLLFQQGLDVWRGYSKRMAEALEQRDSEFDTSVAIGDLRIRPCLQRFLPTETITVVTNSQAFVHAIQLRIDAWQLPLQTRIYDPSEASVSAIEWQDTVAVIYIKPDLPEHPTQMDLTALRKRAQPAKGLVTLWPGQLADRDVAGRHGREFLLQSISDPNSGLYPFECQDSTLALLTVQYCLLAQRDIFSHLLPTYSYYAKEQLLRCVDTGRFEEYFCYDLGWCIGFATVPLDDSFILPNGTRLRYLGQGTKLDYWQDTQIDKKLFDQKKSVYQRWDSIILEDQAYVSK